jgi:hypothetical protein
MKTAHRKLFLKKQGHQQRGIAMLLLVSMMGTAALGLFFSYYFISNSVQQARQSHNVRVLGQAKAALLGYAITGRADTLSADEFNFRQTLGRLPCPNTSGDGVALGGCGTMAVDAAIGLLPWSTLGLGALRDFDGGCLWYGVAPRQKMLNVQVTANTPPDSRDISNLIPAVGLNPDTVASFTIVDANGAVLADDVVAIIAAPGGQLGGQNRNAVAAASACGVSNADTYAVASQYLDQWAAPLEDNARAAQPNSVAARFVSVQMLPNDRRAGVNDHLMWITKAELNQTMMQAAARAMLNRLATYNPQTTISAASFPPAAATPGGVCIPGLVSGFVPTSCPIAVGGGSTWYLEPGYLSVVGVQPRNGMILNQWPMFAHYAVDRMTSVTDLQVDGVAKFALVLIRGQMQRDLNQQPIQNCGVLISATLADFSQCIEGVVDNGSGQYINRQLLTSIPITRNYRTAAYGSPSMLASDAVIGIVNDDILMSR